MAERFRKESITWILAVTGWIVGCVLTLQSVRSAPERVARLQRKLADVQVIEAMCDQAKLDQEALALFDELASHQALPLRELLRKAVPGVVADVRQRPSEVAADGWRLRRSEVVFNDVLLEQVGLFMHTAELQRPPWRVHECNILASERVEGAARVTLLLETLEETGETER